MQYVDYPIAQTLTEAIAWLSQGGELWQEISDDYPECTMIENEADLIEMVYNEDDIEDYNIHMVEGSNED